MRLLHSSMAIRNLIAARNHLRSSRNLSITTSPIITNSLGGVSDHLSLPSPSHHSRSHLSPSSPSRTFQISSLRRSFSTGSSSPAPDVNKVVDEINLKFAEAREEIEMAMDSKETVYFNEEAECARIAVAEVLEMFNGLLEKVTEKEKASLQRSMGLKIEQLKAELQQLNE